MSRFRGCTNQTTTTIQCSTVNQWFKNHDQFYNQRWTVTPNTSSNKSKATSSASAKPRASSWTRKMSTSRRVSACRSCSASIWTITNRPKHAFQSVKWMSLRIRLGRIGTSSILKCHLAQPQSKQAACQMLKFSKKLAAWIRHRARSARRADWRFINQCSRLAEKIRKRNYSTQSSWRRWTPTRTSCFPPWILSQFSICIWMAANHLTKNCQFRRQKNVWAGSIRRTCSIRSRLPSLCERSKGLGWQKSRNSMESLKVFQKIIDAMYAFESNFNYTYWYW